MIRAALYLLALVLCIGIVRAGTVLDRVTTRARDQVSQATHAADMIVGEMVRFSSGGRPACAISASSASAL